ncbi:hypothetical protein BKI52_40740 [marine bacterium AO1-C]|nr:hypothetical protein BKI52_40740 [marine bacterium AO1-C]
MKSILYVTDLYYKAKGRNYYEEDLYITSCLKDHFNILICHPHQVLEFLEVADMIIIRNSGSVIYYKEYYEKFVKEARDRNVTVFNSLDGKADMQGKQYLLELTNADFSVIPTIEHAEEMDLSILGDASRYIVKPKFGADSIGMKILSKDALNNPNLHGMLVQPFINFNYELSFYFLNNQFEYALYAPNKSKRWELEEFIPNETDLDFARQFIQWNNMECGIQRVDACRLPNGRLLLVELEDLNPFLSLDKLSDTNKKQFIENFITAIVQHDQILSTEESESIDQ